MLKSTEVDEKKLVEMIVKGIAKLYVKDHAESGKGGGEESAREKSEDAWGKYNAPERGETSSGSAEWKGRRSGIEDGEKVAVTENKEDGKDWTNEWEEGRRGKSAMGRSKGYQGVCWKCGMAGHKKGECGIRNDGVVGRTGWTGGIGKGVGERQEVGEREKENYKTRWEGGKVGNEWWKKGSWNNEEESWGNKIRRHGVDGEVFGKEKVVYEVEEVYEVKDDATGMVKLCWRQSRWKRELEFSAGR